MHDLAGLIGDPAIESSVRPGIIENYDRLMTTR